MKPGYYYFHSYAAIKNKITLSRFQSRFDQMHLQVVLTFAKIKYKYKLFKREHQIKMAACLADQLFASAFGFGK